MSVGGSLDLTEGSVSLASVPAFEVRGLSAGPSGIGVANLSAQGAKLIVQRGPDGSLDACGLKLIPPSPATANLAPAPTTTGPLFPIPQLPIVLNVAKASAGDAQITWLDRTFEPAVQAQIGVSANAGPVVIDQRPGAAAPQSSPFTAEVSINQTERVSVAGW